MQHPLDLPPHKQAAANMVLRELCVAELHQLKCMRAVRRVTERLDLITDEIYALVEHADNATDDARLAARARESFPHSLAIMQDTYNGALPDAKEAIEESAGIDATLSALTAYRDAVAAHTPDFMPDSMQSALETITRFQREVHVVLEHLHGWLRRTAEALTRHATPETESAA